VTTLCILSTVQARHHCPGPDRARRDADAGRRGGGGPAGVNLRGVGCAWAADTCDGLLKLQALLPCLHAATAREHALTDLLALALVGNSFHNEINSSLFLETAQFMKESGLLAAGYTYITLGGIGYAQGGTWAPGAHGWGPAGKGNITRNASGHLQVDPVRFPGGNEGMRALVTQVRQLGFKWGSYTESGTAGCNGARGSSEGHEEKDAALFFGDFQSEYLMVDGCGIEVQPPPHGPPKDWPVCPGCSPRHAQSRWEMTKWRSLIDEAVAKGAPPIVLHDCHNGCGSDFGGPTLALAPCDASDIAQQWSLPLDGSYGALTSAQNGMCAGCVSVDDCANDAYSAAPNGTYGLGMQACMTGAVNNGALDSAAVAGRGLGSAGQLWNLTSGVITQACEHGACTPPCLAPAPAGIPVVVLRRGDGEGGCPAWTPRSLPSGGPLHQLATTTPEGRRMCLSSRGEAVTPTPDMWCIANNNMWRSNTDVLQNWVRTMVEVESLATQGHISRPGSWSFPDCMELGVPGGGSLTWQESKSVLALFAVTSSPLILGNDARKGRMQERLVQLVTNPDVIKVNQEYSAEAAFAGGRINTSAPAQELWAKPLLNGTAAIVLLNRGGKAVGKHMMPLPPECHKGKECTGCYLPSDQPWLSPCDDDTDASTGAQEITFTVDQLPRSWLMDPSSATGNGHEQLQCDVFDIYATPHDGAFVGRTDKLAEMVPPHGVRFFKLSNCA
jgi:hypothetical protein